MPNMLFAIGTGVSCLPFPFCQTSNIWFCESLIWFCPTFITMWTKSVHVVTWTWKSRETSYHALETLLLYNTCHACCCAHPCCCFCFCVAFCCCWWICRRCCWGPSRHLGSLTAANWVSFDFNVAYSSCWGYSLINTLKLKKKFNKIFSYPHKNPLHCRVNVPDEAVRVTDYEDRLSERTRCVLRTTSAYHLLPNTIQIEIKPTFSPTAVPPPMRTSVTYSKQICLSWPLPGPHSVPLTKGDRHGHADATIFFSFFQFKSRDTEFSAAVHGGHLLCR